MSQMNHAGLKPAVAPVVLDWQPNIDRIRRHADTARATGKADPYAAVEAECWLDLIDAEIAAQKARPAGDEAVATLDQLRGWKVQLQLALRSLQGSGTERRRNS